MTTKRDLDGIYFRVKRGKRWESICFSDLSDEEMDKVLEGHSVQWLKSTCKILGRTIRRIGDELENVSGRKEDVLRCALPYLPLAGDKQGKTRWTFFVKIER